MTALLDVGEPWPDPLGGIDLDGLRRRRTAQWATYDDDVVAAWIADGDGAVCPAVRSAIDDLLDRGDLTYPSDAPPRELAEAFASRMDTRFGWRADPARVMPFADVVQAVSFAIDRLTAPGDPVMLHVPGFPPFLQDIAALGRRLAPLPFERAGDGWAAPIDAVRAAADDGARLLLLVNPHNPLGVVWDRDDLVELAELVVERDLRVVADEIYGDLVLDDDPHVPFASLGDEVESRTITVTSAAKSHNIAGVRCAVAHVGARCDALASVPASQIGQVSNIGFEATLAAWRDGDDWLDAYVAALAERRDRFAAAVADLLPAAEHVPPRGTFVAWVDVSALGLPGPPAGFFLERARVALDAGEAYGPGGEGCVRVCLATSTAILDEVIERMVTAIDIWRAAP